MSILFSTVKLGILFTTLFTSYTSYQNIITQVYEQQQLNHLGNYNLFTIYSAFMLGNLIAPRIANYLKFKTLLALGTILYTLNFSGGLFTLFITNKSILKFIILLFGALSGFGGSILWVSQGGYMHLICKQHNISSQKGYYFGIFYSLYSLSNVTGAVATTFLLGFLSHQWYFLIITGLGVFSTLFCIFFLQDPQNVQKKLQRNSQSQINKPINQRQSSETVQYKQQSIIQSIIKIFKFYPKMKVLLPFVGIVGLIIGFYSSSLHYLVQNSLPKDSSSKFINMRTGISLILLGVGSILGSYTSGLCSDNMKIRVVGSLGISSYLLFNSLVLFSDQFQNYILVTISSFLIGFSQNFIQNWILIVCSRNLNGALQSFAINKQFHSLTFCLYQLIIIFLKPSFRLLVPILIILSLPLVIALVFIKQSEQSDIREYNQIKNVQ